MNTRAKKAVSGKKWIAIVVVLIVVGGFYFFFGRDSKPKVTFREQTVARGNLSLTIVATGSVMPQNRLEIKPPIAGRVDQVLIKEGQKVQKGQILAWMSSSERAALIDAARAQGDAEVKKWEDLYRATPIVAPISGTIIARNVESGQTFSSTEAILVMSDRLTVKAQVDETDIARIKLKQAAVITLDAYANERIPGKVDEIAYESKAVNNVTTYAVDVLPEQTPAFMRAGMTANVSFVVAASENVILVPTEVVKTRAGKSTVLVTDETGKHVSREITLGLTDGKYAEVLSGLKEGEKIFSLELNLNAPKKTGISLFGPPTRPRTRSGRP